MLHATHNNKALQNDWRVAQHTPALSTNLNYPVCGCVWGWSGTESEGEEENVCEERERERVYSLLVQ